jgi:predicted metal-dependent peptidase
MTTKLKFDTEKKHAPITRDQQLTNKQSIEWEKTRAAFLTKCPAFSHVFYTLMAKHAGEHLAVFTSGVPIAATDGQMLFLNADKYFPLSLQERVFVIAHEVAHCIFDHCGLMHGYRRRGKIKYADGTELEYHSELMNIATDLVINDMLIESKIGKYNKDWLYDPSLGVFTDSVIDVYKKVYKQAEKNGALPKGVSFDLHLAPGAGKGQDANTAVKEREAMTQEWKVAVAAGMAAAKAQGKLSAGLERLLGDQMEPQVSWQEHIQGFFARKVGSGSYNWRKPDRRFIVRPEQMYSPGPSGFGAEHVVVQLDTSGSINQETIDMFLAEVGGILEDVRPKRITVLWVDSEIAGIDEVEEGSDLSSLKPKGGGGTNMARAFEWITQQGIEDEIDCLLTLTDGYTPFPPCPSYPVLWGSITPAGSVTYPFGEVVYIPQQAKKKRAA